MNHRSLVPDYSGTSGAAPARPVRWRAGGRPGRSRNATTVLILTLGLVGTPLALSAQHGAGHGQDTLAAKDTLTASDTLAAPPPAVDASTLVLGRDTVVASPG